MHKPTLPSDNAFWTISANRNRLRVLSFLAAVVLAAGLAPGHVALAANILNNPGFEPNITGWTKPGGSWQILSDSYAHSGNSYYQVWGAYSGSPNEQMVYQEKGALPTSTYQADGWLFTKGSDAVWGGDDLDYCYLEVSFRDASDNILALYRSDKFSDTLGSVPYTTDVWYNFPITNVCQTVSPYSVIGSTNVLVAPAGTVKVRYQHTLYQVLWGGGSCYFDDATLNQTGGPLPPEITQVYPGNLLLASNQISFHVTSATSTPINTSNIHLVVNGVDVSAGCIFSGSTPDISVLYTGLSTNVWSYTASITVADDYNLTASTTMNFDTVQPALVWEGEDYDFTNSVSGGGGSYINSPMLASTPTSGSYFGALGALNVDYFRANNSGQNATYRTNDWTGIGSANGEIARQKFLNAQATNAAIIDYTVGYINQGDWMNYTRNYPAGTYNIYGRFSGGAGATDVALTNVTTGTLLGDFRFTGSDWNSYQYVPLVDTNDNLIASTFDGNPKTLSATLISGGDTMNFFMLVPAVPGLPSLSNISPANGTVFVTNNTFSFTASSTATLNNSGIHLYVNGADVTSGLAISGSSTSKNVSWPLVQSNTFYTVVIAVTNASGAGVSRTVQFNTMSAANFYVKIADFDYSSGQYDSVNNGLLPNGYLGINTAVLGVDYNHGSDGGFSYRAGLATEVTSDYPLPGYSAGNDYDAYYFNSGDWGNYTRVYPPGKYYVYARLSGYNSVVYLDKVTSGWGTSSQTTQRLGEWSANPNGWGNWTWVMLKDMNLAAPAVVTLSGSTSTLRVTSGGGVNANYFMLVPVQGINISAAKSGSNLNISFPTQAGSGYRVFYTTNLMSGVWNLLSTVAGDGTMKSASDATTDSQRFYKVTSP